MINKKHFINELNNLSFFKKINKFEKKKLSKLDFLIAYREDGLGNCVLNYLNVCRIGKKLNLEVKLYWNKEINKREEILFGVKNEYSGFSNLNIFKFIDKNKQTLKANPRWIYDEKFWIFEEENHLDVLNEICKLAKKLKIQPDIQKRINKIKNKKFKYSYHIRNETMTATEGNIDTKNKYYKWYDRDNLNLGKWFPENLIDKIIKNITSNNKEKLLLITSDIKFKNKLKKIKNVKMNPLYNSKESGLNQLFLDLYILPKAENFICNPSSGYSLFAALLSRNYVYFPTDFVSSEDIFHEFKKIIISQFYKLRSPTFMLFKIIKIIFSKIYKFYLYTFKEFFRERIN
jgi:hypothetical protein